MGAVISIKQKNANRADQEAESMIVRIGNHAFFGWVIFCGFCSVAYSTSFYLLTGGPRRDHSVYRKWNVRMAKTLFRSTGIKVETRYLTRLDTSQPYIFISNHQSFLDIPIAALAIPCPYGYVAKIELARIPFLGSAIKYSPSVFVDRSNPRKAVESMLKAADAIRGGTSVVMYPEGGRSYCRTLRPFKKGAFVFAIQAGVPIVPIIIKDAYRILNEREKSATKGTVHVIVGKPISLDGLSRKDAPELMNRVASIMRRELEPETPLV